MPFAIFEFSLVLASIKHCLFSHAVLFAIMEIACVFFRRISLEALSL